MKPKALSKTTLPIVVAPEHQLVSADYICAALGLTWFGLHKMIKQGRLPAPIVFGYKCHRWPLAVVDQIVAGTWLPSEVTNANY